MAGLNEIARKRKVVLRAVLTTARKVEDSINSTQAVIRRLLTRKRLVPEAAEYVKIVDSIQAADSAMNELATVVAQGSTIFNG
jgi:hypothetical protein